MHLTHAIHFKNAAESDEKLSAKDNRKKRELLNNFLSNVLIYTGQIHENTFCQPGQVNNFAIPKR